MKKNIYKKLLLSQVLEKLLPKAKRIFLVGNFGNGNFGDELLLRSVATDLNNSHYYLTIVARKKEHVSVDGDIVTPFSLQGVWKMICSNVLVIGPGGFFGRDAGPFSRIVYPMVKLFKFLGKKVVFYGFGIYETCPVELWKPIISACLIADHVSVRDKPSHLFLKRRTPSLPVNLILDPVFNLDLPEKQKKNLRKNFVLGLSLRFIEDQHDRKSFLHVFANALNNLSKKITILPLNFYFEPKLFLKKPHPSDSLIVEELKKLVNNPLVIFGKNTTSANLDELINQFLQIDALIGMRFHAQVLAIHYQLPLLAIGYSPKNELARDYSKSTFTELNQFSSNLVSKFIHEAQ